MSNIFYDHCSFSSIISFRSDIISLKSFSKSVLYVSYSQLLHLSKTSFNSVSSTASDSDNFFVSSAYFFARLRYSCKKSFAFFASRFMAENSRFDAFTYRNVRISSFCSEDWIEQVAIVIENELYNDSGINNQRAYTNVKMAYDDIKLDFYHRMNEIHGANFIEICLLLGIKFLLSTGGCRTRNHINEAICVFIYKADALI